VLSNDRKKTLSYVAPLRVRGDRSRHDKVVNSFKSISITHAPDVAPRLLRSIPRIAYLCVVNTRIKLIDRFEIEMPKFVVIDPAQGAIVKTFEYPKKSSTHSRASADSKFRRMANTCTIQG